MDVYLGKDSAKDTGWFTSTGPLKENILRAQGIYITDSSYSPGWTDLNFICAQPNATAPYGVSTIHCRPGAIAVSWNINGYFKNLVSCTHFPPSSSSSSSQCTADCGISHPESGGILSNLLRKSQYSRYHQPSQTKESPSAGHRPLVLHP